MQNFDYKPEKLFENSLQQQETSKPDTKYELYKNVFKYFLRDQSFPTVETKSSGKKLLYFFQLSDTRKKN